ncbi:hypothetical protein Zmor_021919 [Zophobas morio]|uniref:Uncharacterized protein n=1 Tax=Zophobas morio TaxID=2755281 RepID=A0AA38I3E0_9CUCU|nr:hypothetical protein Zmor_021919 [Zophobas morio]
MASSSFFAGVSKNVTFHFAASVFPSSKGTSRYSFGSTLFPTRTSGTLAFLVMFSRRSWSLEITLNDFLLVHQDVAVDVDEVLRREYGELVYLEYNYFYLD